MNTRIEQLLRILEQRGLDGIIINNLKNVYYLTGFWGSNGTVFISKERQVLVTDARYIVHAEHTVKDVEVVSNRDELSVISAMVRDSNLKRIGFEDEISVAYFNRMTTHFSGVELVAQTNLVQSLRLIKDQGEIALIQKACQISDQAFTDVLDFITVGKTELEIADFLDFRMRELGASGVSFDTILASGMHSSMPHAQPTHKIIQEGDAITLDFGCIYQHYVSDMTRTIYVGHISEEEEKIYQAVLQANQALIAQAKAGLPFKEVDKIPRDIIIKAGYGDFFTHGIGHGMGLDVHEEPYFSQTSTDFLKAGMVVTDEPGIYIDEQYGVRIEDDLLITETGCTVLTHAPKELIIL